MKNTIIFLICLISFIQILNASSPFTKLSKIIDSVNNDSPLNNQQVRVGAASVDITPEVGVPLAGYGARTVESYPIPKFTKWTAFMKPSTSVTAPLYIKCIAIEESKTRSNLMFLGIDAIGAGKELLQEAYDIAHRNGGSLNTPFKNMILSASHTHNAMGAVAKQMAFQLSATDLYKQELVNEIATKIARCMSVAENSLKVAKIGVSSEDIHGYTRNRRSRRSHHVNETSIDPQLGVIKFDSAIDDTPIATLWNFAMHGTCSSSKTLDLNTEPSGTANKFVERIVGGVSLFINGAAGDIAPIGDKMCTRDPETYDYVGGIFLAEKIKEIRDKTIASSDANVQLGSHFFDFKTTQLNLTYGRLANCREEPSPICTLCSNRFLNCQVNLRVGNFWLSTDSYYSAVRFSVNGKHTLLVTAPGEAVQEIAHRMKSDAKNAGFDKTFFCGYSNNHLGYFTTEEEYEVGGYESTMSFFGIKNGVKLRENMNVAMNMVKPSQK